MVAAGLALQAALGPAMVAIVEAIKATGLLPPGWGGAASLGVGVGLGMLTGAVAWHRVDDAWWVVVGAFAGLLLGAGGVSQHQAQIGFAALQRKRGRLAIRSDDHDDEADVWYSGHPAADVTVNANDEPSNNGPCDGWKKRVTCC